MNTEQIKREYESIWGSAAWKNKKEEISMEEKLNKFIEENKIKVDDEGNFEMYAVVDVDDKDNIKGITVKDTDTIKAYTEKRIYDVLKDNAEGFVSNFSVVSPIIGSYLNNTYTPKQSKERKSIRENLLNIEDKIIKILVNKENVTEVLKDKLRVNKYKVVDEINLNPRIKFKINNICNSFIDIILYNNLTMKKESIEINIKDVLPTIEEIKRKINIFLDKNEAQTKLYNTTIDDGIEI